jgi:diguanylate cyclase (GGDEF)-like protein
MGSSQLRALPRPSTGAPLDPAAHRLAAVLELSAAAVVELDPRGRVLTWNAAAERLFGWPAADVLGRPDPSGATVSGTGPVARSHRDGRRLELRVAARSVTDQTGRLLSTVLSYATDCVDGRHEELQHQLRGHLRRQQSLATLGQVALHSSELSAVLQAAVETVAVTLDLNSSVLIRRVRGGELSFAATYGWTPPPGMAPQSGPLTTWVLDANRSVVAPDISVFPGSLRELLTSLGVRSSAAIPVSGVERPWGALIAHSALPAGFGEDDLHFLQAVGNVVAAAVARDDAERELRFRAGHDALTGLPSRELLHERLAGSVAGARGTGCALILADLDGFKDVNDSQGHLAGDRVLEQVADRLRTWSQPNDLVARLGGDEFAVLLAGIGDLAEAASRAHQLQAVLRVPFGSPGGPVSLGASIGVAVEPSGGDPERMLRRADAAMYRAKRDRVGVVAHDPAHDIDAGERLARVTALRTAIAGGQLTVAYQPVISLDTGVVTAVEALARWTHPQLGPQSPLEFVTLAEQSGMIVALTESVLRASAGQAATWLRAGRDLPVAVNLSPAMLGSPDYADHLAALLAEVGLPARQLRIEVTESTLASESAVLALRRIHALGVQISIDDFGTGYSSLGRIKQLPVQTVKIDREFVKGICEDRRDVAIVRSVVALAADLGLDVIAEGVETPQVAQALQDLGVLRAQGYLFSRPLPAGELELWHDRWLAGEHVAHPGQP